jgi:RNA polymerase sigma-70 factor (ECF subfamily)
MQYPLSVDAASSKPGELVLPVQAAQPSAALPEPALQFPGPSPMLLQELWIRAEAETCGLTPAEFGSILASVGAKVNYGLPPGILPDSSQKTAFFRGLHLSELALAHACALSREIAWERFLSLYRATLVHAAIAIAGSATLGEELADSLYAELYGLRQLDGERRSPLATYSGRGSLIGWLRTTLVQRFRDHHRRTWRESPLDEIESPPIADLAAAPVEAAAGTAILTEAVGRTLKNLDPEDRFLLVAYYLDRQTLLEIARTLGVHEATVSRRLKRLLASLRNQLLRNLCLSGLSRAAAEDALGADPRDIEINLRALLQTSQTAAFSNQTASATTAASG